MLQRNNSKNTGNYYNDDFFESMLTKVILVGLFDPFVAIVGRLHGYNDDNIFLLNTFFMRLIPPRGANEQPQLNLSPIGQAFQLDFTKLPYQFSRNGFNYVSEPSPTILDYYTQQTSSLIVPHKPKIIL